MFDSTVSLTSILVSLEGVLKIEYNQEDRVQDIINKSIERLESQYGPTLDKDIYTLQSENQLTADALDKLLREIKAVLEQMSFYITLKYFHKNLPFTLADINYLSHARLQLLSALKCLMDVNHYKNRHADICPPLYSALDNVGICTPKRLFICMLMLERLGVAEGVCTCATLLYMGGLVD